MDTNISRPDPKAQQSDCLPTMSRAYMVRRMPAKELSPEQKVEADRLKARFKEWQAERRKNGLPWTQEAAADEFGFGQSALSQYLGGDIPLNASAVKKFAEVLGLTPMDISPTVVEQARASAASAQEFLRLVASSGGRIEKRERPAVERRMTIGPNLSTKKKGAAAAKRRKAR